MTTSGSYVVQYGRNAFLGRFNASVNFVRGQRVVVDTPRGRELGSILCEESELAASMPVSGAVLRLASAQDDELETRARQRGEAILVDAQRLVEEDGLPLALFDVEVLLEGDQAIVQAVHWAACDATPVLERLSQVHGIAVKLQDDSRAPRHSHGGCGKPGCGSESGGCSSCGSGGGCSTGSCSRGAVKSAGELTAYFAGLRAQMEAQRQRVPLS